MLCPVNSHYDETYDTCLPCTYDACVGGPLLREWGLGQPCIGVQIRRGDKVAKHGHGGGVKVTRVVVAKMMVAITPS